MGLGSQLAHARLVIGGDRTEVADPQPLVFGFRVLPASIRIGEGLLAVRASKWVLGHHCSLSVVKLSSSGFTRAQTLART
jgi:hypothetical protein